VVWTGLLWLSIGTSSCGHGNEPVGSIKCWEIESLSDWRLLQKGSVLWGERINTDFEEMGWMK
jgi:hypothetical protein